MLDVLSGIAKTRIATRTYSNLEDKLHLLEDKLTLDLESFVRDDGVLSSGF